MEGLTSLSLIQGTVIQADDIYAYLKAGTPLPLRSESIDCAPLFAEWAKSKKKDDKPQTTPVAPVLRASTPETRRSEVIENHCLRQKAFAEWNADEPKYTTARPSWTRRY
jgi:hypothetical protein